MTIASSILDEQNIRTSEVGAWSAVLSSGYFPIDVTPAAPGGFNGSIDIWSFDQFRLAKSQSTPARYKRPPSAAIMPQGDVSLTFCVGLEIRIHGFSHDRSYQPGHFFLYPSDNRFNWDQLTEGEMWTLYLPRSLLSQRIGDLQCLYGRPFDLMTNAGRILLDMLRLVSSHVQGGSTETLRGLRALLIDLIALAIEEDERRRAPMGASRHGQMAHLRRIEQHIEDNLADADLSPSTIADACGISTRYLHEIFSAKGTTVSRWILEKRLEGARKSLNAPGRAGNISQVAQAWGFSDHSHFTRQFRAKFGFAPREARSALV